MRHVRFPNIFALGDAGSSPNSKAGAAIRKQAPVVVTQDMWYLKRYGLPALYWNLMLRGRV